MEYLAIKLGEVELEEDQVDEILALAQAQNPPPPPVLEEEGGGEDSDETGEDKEDAADQDQEPPDADLDAPGQDASDGDLSHEVGGEDLSVIDGADGTVVASGAEGQQLGKVEIKMEIKKVQDAKTGVLAKLRETMAKLHYIHNHLEQQRGGVPKQTKQNAEAKASGSANLKVTLDEAQHNMRIPMSRGRTTPRRTDDDDDDEDLEDRGSIKNKAERLVAKKKREEAARFDEFGNEIIPKKDEKAKKK